MHTFCNNGWAYYGKVQEIMPSDARGTTLFHPAEGPPVSVNGRVDSVAIMMQDGGSMDASGGNDGGKAQGNEDIIIGTQYGVPRDPPVPSSGSKCKFPITDDDVTSNSISSSKSLRTSVMSFTFSSCKSTKAKSVTGIMVDGLENIGGIIE
jgi:hypothetical protein